MKVGINPAAELKEISEKNNVPFSDTVLQFVQEDFIRRIDETGNSDLLWLQDSLPWDNHLEKIKLIYHHKSENTLDEAKVERLIETLLSEKNDIAWSYSVRKEGNAYIMGMQAVYKEMQIPFSIFLSELTDNQAAPEKKTFRCMLRQIKQVSYNIYSPKEEIGSQLIEIFEKLELISDMKAYYIVNETLKNKSVSGRRIMETMTEYFEKSPKTLKEKRLEQIKSYRDYSYMRKRWEKYCKKDVETDSWADVIDRLSSFAGPIWTALCRNEIFFDDWMPELGRFLG